MNKRLLDAEVMSNVFFNMRTGRELWAPVDFMYDKNEETLKACLKKHFETVVFDQLVKQKVIE